MQPLHSQQSFSRFSKELWVSRVDEETEVKGLDVEEHGAPAYAQSSTITAAPEPAVATVEA